MRPDPVDLTAQLVRCASVTPEDNGALDIIAAPLEAAGFSLTWVERGGIRNLFARWGSKGHARSFGFNGHTDVVPIGDAADWSQPPFGAKVIEGTMYGRGTADMKSGVAAFVAAAIQFVSETPPDGAILIAITGDEEGDALDGTRALLDHMAEAGEVMSACLVGEPTCPETLGEMIKIGRRGSMSAWFEVTGIQGHSAYLHRARNPLPPLMRLMDRLASHTLDAGTAHFDPSTLAVVSVDTGNPATNVIPAKARAALNIRFNDLHTGESLTSWLQHMADEIATAYDVDIQMKFKVSGEAFLTPPGPLSQLVTEAVQAETGVTPKLSTSGGTSDARFIKTHCPVVEFGLVGQSMHQVDEHVELSHIRALTQIYRRILQEYFA